MQLLRLSQQSQSFLDIRIYISQLCHLSVRHAKSTRSAMHWRVILPLLSSCRPDKIGKSAPQRKGCCSTVWWVCILHKVYPMYSRSIGLLTVSFPWLLYV